MKKVRVILGTCFLLLILGACSNDSIKLGAESRWEVQEPEGFSFDLVEATPNQITAIIINHSTETLCWGSYFALEKNVDGVWYELEVQLPEGTGLSWNACQYTTAYEEEDVLGYTFELFGELPEGEYRIVKEFKYETPSKETWVVACEFTIDE